MGTETIVRNPGGAFGQVLRNWRRTRGLSQLSLALESEVSQRHISFLESGRSHPSREMVLRLATVLDVSLREQNVLLAVAGFAQAYQERDLDDPTMAQVRKALDFMLRQQEPYPAVVVDRHWYVLAGNTASTRLTAWLGDPRESPHYNVSDDRVNLMRFLFHPAGWRPFVTNWQEVAGWLIERLHREVITDGQSVTSRALLDEMLTYPDVPRAWRTPNWEVASTPLLTLDLLKDGLNLRSFSTITTLGTPHDITLQELRLESWFPADEATENYFRTGVSSSGSIQTGDSRSLG
ncbi:XRE family transcriptional regulator [Candidatus Entotheonella serta]|nr:XRE family transcriptional regulator [Candidatus Entotheonella serta]